MNHSAAYAAKSFDHLDKMDELSLDNRKRELQLRGRNDPKGNSVDELEEIVYIITKLRSGRTGPPKAKTARPSKVEKSAADIAF